MPKEPLLTPEQQVLNAETFDEVWTIIRDNHWDPELGGLDWEAVRDELRPAAEQATRMSESRGAMREMIARLEATHFGIIPGEAYDDLDEEETEDEEAEESEDGTTGINVRVVDGHALVVSVEEGSQAQQQGISPGWEIVRIGGKDVAPAIKRISKEYEGKTRKDAVLARSVSRKLRGNVGDVKKVRFINGQGRKVDVDVELGPESGWTFTFGHMPEVHVRFESKTIEGDIGYVTFNGFFDPGRMMPLYNKAIMSLMDARGVIIDLRGNPGGIGAMAMGMSGWFVGEKRTQLGTTYMRSGELKSIVNPRSLTFDGPLVILVDGLSGSTSEIMVGGLKDLGRACVVGSRTAGAALPSRFVRLPNGDGLQYAFANYISVGGKALEGIGVTPDIEVYPSREALLEGRDLVLEAAVDWIRSQ